MKNTKVDHASAEKVTTSLVTVVDCALLLRSMIPPTEFVIFLARTTKCGIPSSEPVDVYPATISSTESAQLVTLRPSSTITSISAAIAWMATRKLQVKVVKESAFLFAQSTKTTS
jgi:hypothetical protein